MGESVEHKLKHLLIKAWRERWSDITWGIYVKEVLPSGDSGDEYNLSENILKQAIVGPTINPLLLSYLKYCLSAQVVSYSSVINSICQQCSGLKGRCLGELLRLLQQSLEHATCSGSVEECALLASSLLSLKSCLLNTASEYLSRLCDPLEGTPPPGSSEDILNLSVNLLETLLRDEFLSSLLYTGRCSNPHLCNLSAHSCTQAEAALSCQPQSDPPQLVSRLKHIISRCRSLEEDLFGDSKTSTTTWPTPRLYTSSLCTDVHTLISLEALLRATSDGQQLSRQLELLAKVRGYTPTQLYCEILRACCLGLADTVDSSGELRWAVFTFLKIPSLFLQLHRILNGMEANTPIVEASGQVAAAFERLLCYPGLLEMTDAKCHCNVVEELVNVVKSRTELLSEWHVTTILTKRRALVGGGLKLEAGGSTQTATLILRAEPTVASILKTLDTDPNKNQDTLLAVLSHLLSGKSFELILNAATGTGKLAAFATKLVRFNEATRQPGPDSSAKSANVRALLFDISFLMLCRITQMYGLQIIVTPESSGETFFERWASDWLKPRQAPDLNLGRCDMLLTEQLLKALSSGDSDLRSGSVRWHDACLHVPAVVREILEAWQEQLISDEDVERILDTMRTQMCCLSVCAAAWLRYYIQVQPAVLKRRPTSMLEHLMTPLNQEDVKEQYKERTVLMLQVIRRLAQDDAACLAVQEPATSDSDSRGELSFDHQFSKLWTKILDHGWPDHGATTGIERLYGAAGAPWLITALVKALIKEQSSERRQRCVQGVLAVAHLDLESCAVFLAAHALPDLMTRSSTLASDEEIGGPGGEALAQLTVWLLAAALNDSAAAANDPCSRRSGATTTNSSRTGKRFGNDDPPPVGQPPLKKMAAIEREFQIALPTSCEERSVLERAVTRLMELMTQVAKEGIITPQLSFVRHLLQALASTVNAATRIVLEPLLKLLSPALVFYMMAIWPDLMSITNVAQLLAQPADCTGAAKVAARIICAFKNTSPRHSRPL